MQENKLISLADRYIDMPQPLGLFASDLYRRGVEYLDAFEELTERENAELLFASYFLFAHALELLLKAFLAAKGTTKRQVRRLGHNLPKIMSQCVRHELPNINLLQEYVAHTYEMNRDFDFRYPSGYNLSMPRPAECLPIVRELMAVIGPTIQQAALRAQLRFSSETKHLKGMVIRWSD